MKTRSQHMRRYLGIMFLSSLFVVGPVCADWRLTAGTAVWFVQRPTADMIELRAALLWHYESNALDGLIVTAARPSIAVSDLGDGNSELSVSVARTTGEAWINSFATGRCSAVSSLAARSVCVDAAIKTDIRRIWLSYRVYLRDLTSQVVEPSLP